MTTKVSDEKVEQTPGKAPDEGKDTEGGKLEEEKKEKPKAPEKPAMIPISQLFKYSPMS